MNFKKPISERAQAIIMLCLIAFLLLGSVVLWIIYHTWYAGLIHWVVLYFMEWGARAKQDDLKPPVFYTLYKYAKRKLIKPQPIVVPETPIIEEQPTETAFIPKVTSIAKWMVAEMIDCTIYGNYSSIGEGMPEQIQTALQMLLSQYYENCNNEYMKSYVHLKGQIMAIEAQWELVNVLATLMHERYSPAGAAVFKNLYPFGQYNCTFAKDTFENDWKRVCAGEIRNKRNHEALTKELSEMEKEQAKSDKLTPENRHKNLINRLMDINKTEGVRYDINTMTVLELAIAENRLNQHIKNLQEQIAKK